MVNGQVVVDILGRNERLNRSLQESEGTIRGWGRTVTGIVAGVAAAFATREAFRFAGGLIELANEQIAAETRLEAVLNATGNAAGFSADQLKLNAQQLQNTVGIGDEVVLGAQAIIATFREIKGDQFLRTTELAADLAEVLGGDLSGQAKTLATALNDPIKGVTRLTRVGVTFTEEQKNLIASLQETGDVAAAQNVILDEVANQVGGAAAAQFQTFAGQIDDVTNRLGDIGEVLGGVLISALEAVGPVIEGTVSFLENLANGIAANQAVINAFVSRGVDLFIDGLELMADAAVTAFTVIETVWNNLGTVTELTVAASALSIVQFGENIRHVFTVVIPTVVAFGVANWDTLLQDFANLAVTAFQNVLTNATNFMTAISNVIQGRGFNFTPIGLLEGFEATTKELPKIAERQVGVVEGTLQALVDSAATRLNDNFSDNLEENQRQFNALFDRAPIDLEAPEANINVEREPPIAAEDTVITVKEDQADKDERSDREARTIGEAVEQGFRSSLESLTSLRDRISSAAASTDSAPDIIARGLQDQAEVGQQAVQENDNVSREVANNTNKTCTLLEKLITVSEQTLTATNNLETRNVFSN